MYYNNKKVTFNNNITIFDTYSKDEYDRFPIDSILYKKNYNKITDIEWNNIFLHLDLYKLYEMTVHKFSLHNNKYHTKKFN